MVAAATDRFGGGFGLLSLFASGWLDDLALWVHHSDGRVLVSLQSPLSGLLGGPGHIDGPLEACELAARIRNRAFMISLR